MMSESDLFRWGRVQFLCTVRLCLGIHNAYFYVTNAYVYMFKMQYDLRLELCEKMRALS